MSKPRVSFFFWLGLSLLISILAYWRWFFTPDIYAWGDWGYHNLEFIRQLFGPPQAWHPEFLGLVDIGLPQYVSARLFYSILAHFLPFVGYDRLVFLIPSVLVPAVSVYLLAYHTTKNPLAGFVSSIVYSFNTYTLILNTGHMTLSISYAIAPLVFLLYRAAVHKCSLKYSLGAGLAGFLCAAYEPRGFFLVAALLFLYLAYTSFLFKFPIKNIMLGILPLVIVGLSNSYWILGLSQTAKDYQGVVVDRLLVGEYSHILPRALLLASPWWTGNSQMAWGQTQSILLYFWPIPVIALMGFWTNRRNADFVFWLIISLIGIFLVKSLGEPFGQVYVWLYSHLPGFNAFRDSSKFNFYISLGYSVLIAGFISRLKFSRAKILFTAAVLAIFLYNALPLVKGQLGRLHTPRHIPKDYLILNNLLKSQPPFFRVLYVPQYSRWAYRDIDRRMLGMTLLVQNEWRLLNNYTEKGLAYSSFEDITGLLGRPYADSLLDTASIKYVIVPPEDLENEEMFIYPRDTSPQSFIDLLDQLPYLSRVDLGTQKLAIYENQDYSPRFSFTPDVGFSATCSRPTLCVITVDSAATAVRLRFSEKFHPGWQAKIDNQPLPDSAHISTQAFTNEFLLPKILPGSQINIFFRPQSYVDAGTIISALALTITLALLALKIWPIRRF